MRIPVIRGLIDRRILVNYRVDPEVLTRILPRPFRPKLVNGHGMAGICLIRLKHIRPRWLPAFAGIGSENAAHRIAVEWEADGEQRHGVYIPRRDTSSWLNTFAGGRIFPGSHHHSRFQVKEADGLYRIEIGSDDGQMRVAVEGRLAKDLPETSIFTSLAEASAFFAAGALGYSVTPTPNAYDGLELRTLEWHVEPLEVSRVESSYFENPKLFPPGSTAFDCALLMRNIPHEWHGRDSLCMACAT